jgi:hypothetical protein
MSSSGSSSSIGGSSSLLFLFLSSRGSCLDVTASGIMCKAAYQYAFSMKQLLCSPAALLRDAWLHF